MVRFNWFCDWYRSLRPSFILVFCFTVVGSWINFAINANAALQTAKNQWDKVSANFQAKTFIPDPILSKEALIAESEQRRQQMKELPIATEVKPNPNEATGKAPVATDVKPVKPQASKPVKSSKVGGRRKKRKKKTKKKEPKKTH